MKVADSMHTAPITVFPEDLVRTARQHLRAHRMRHLPVVTKDNTLVGILTDRDIRQAGASDEPHLAEHELTYLLDKMTVQELMTRQVVTATPYLPGLERLKAQLPALQLTPDGLRVPIRSCSPESVLADCLAHGIQVIGSRIVYDASFTLSSESG